MQFEDRGFGFANDLLFTYPIALAVGLCILFRTDKLKIIHAIIFLPIFLLAISINARTALVVMLSYLLIYLFSRFTLKILLKICIYITAFILLMFGFYNYGFFTKQLEFASLMFVWIYNFLIGGSNIGHFALLFGDFIFWPNDITSFFFGSGIDVFQDVYPRSDVGYVIQINYGGVLYLSLILLMFFYKCVNNICLLRKKTFARDISLVFLLSSLLINFKGYFFTFNPAISIFSLLMLYFYMNRSSFNKNVKRV
ncbi:hypothetical protein ACRN9C_08865 [Shewanella frigidimarina]